MAYNEDSSGSGHDEPWIQWFCGLKGHEMFCEVERAYIEDGFNLYGLRACVPNFSDCLDLILDRIGPDDSDDSHLTQSACTLYGLIHARYIITAHGLDAMYNKYAAKEFGTCPLVQCQGQPVLPVGVKDEVGADTVKVFCPKCQCVYHPPPSRSRGGSGAVDGAAFGTTFPHLFLMTFSNLVPDGLSPESAYVPRVFGFRVHQSARQRGGLMALSNAPANANNNNVRGGREYVQDRANAMATTTQAGVTTDAAISAIDSTARTLPPAAEETVVKVRGGGGGQSQQNDLQAQRVDMNAGGGSDQDDKTAMTSAASSFPQSIVTTTAKGLEPMEDADPVASSSKSQPGGALNARSSSGMNKTDGMHDDGVEMRNSDGMGDAIVESDGDDGNKKQNNPASYQGSAKRKSKNASGGSVSPGGQLESNGNGNGKGNADFGDSSVKSKAKRQKRPSNGVT